MGLLSVASQSNRQAARAPLKSYKCAVLSKQTATISLPNYKKIFLKCFTNMRATHTHTRTTDLTHVLWSGKGGGSGSERGSAVTLHGSPFVACCCSAQRRHFTLPALCSYYTASPLCLLLLPPLPASPFSSRLPPRISVRSVFYFKFTRMKRSLVWISIWFWDLPRFGFS